MPVVVPAPAILKNRKLTPHVRGLLPTLRFNIIIRARKGPLRPGIHVTMLYRVVVDVVDRRPEVLGVLHRPIGNGVPDFTSARFLFAVPLERGAAVKQAKVF